MRLPSTLVLLLVAYESANVAAFEFAPHRSFVRATEHLHGIAKRGSAGFARDLRLAMRGLGLQQDVVQNPMQADKVYCIRPESANDAVRNGDNGTSPATATAAGGNGGSGTGSATRTNGATATAVPSSAFNLVQSYAGQSFFDGWSFWNLPDPTNGIVDFLSQPDAQSAGLIEINDQGNAVMKVDTTSTITGNRKSVRITTDATFTGGIFVLDAVHMPQGCGTWPAFWSDGPDWPNNGEIDIVEGVNDYTNNQATLHTASGCTIASNSTAQSLAISSTLVGPDNCAAAETNNAGCGQRSNSNTTYGSGFNSIGGGVYAMNWDDNGIEVYFFPRGQIPNDLLAEAPQPSTWGTAMARWPATSCNTTQFFKNHSIIFDTTLCGDWAGGVWDATGVPGQDQSCATRTGYATCEQFVQNSGASFSDAYWEVSSVKVYQTTRTP